ncbi:MAG TPA: hypothetical protein VHE30_23495 [Polyangiaceae bacterium]|nr:hypothetical protein [Polyangiaceae bacterium]
MVRGQAAGMIALALASFGCGAATGLPVGGDGGGCQGSSCTPAPARNPACPAALPLNGMSCDEAVDCAYPGTGDQTYCTRLATCADSGKGRLTWTVTPQDQRCTHRSSCPKSFADAQGPCSADANEVCAYAEGGCQCSQWMDSTCSAPVQPTWDCVPWSVGCPTTRPLLGDACPEEGAQCGGRCGSSIDGPLLCSGGYWARGSDGPCPSCPLL